MAQILTDFQTESGLKCALLEIPEYQRHSCLSWKNAIIPKQNRIVQYYFWDKYIGKLLKLYPHKLSLCMSVRAHWNDQNSQKCTLWFLSGPKSSEMDRLSYNVILRICSSQMSEMKCAEKTQIKDFFMFLPFRCVSPINKVMLLSLNWHNSVLGLDSFSRLALGFVRCPSVKEKQVRKTFQIFSYQTKYRHILSDP